jgi:hypothetical protein
MIVICFISGWRGKIPPVILDVLCSDNDASHHRSPLLVTLLPPLSSWHPRPALIAASATTPSPPSSQPSLPPPLPQPPPHCTKNTIATPGARDVVSDWSHGRRRASPTPVPYHMPPSTTRWLSLQFLSLTPVHSCPSNAAPANPNPPPPSHPDNVVAAPTMQQHTRRLCHLLS